jgi:hypothetical protein
MRWVSAVWGALLYATLLRVLAYTTEIPPSSAANKGVVMCFVLLAIHDALSSDWTPMPAVWAAIASHWLMNTATADLQAAHGSGIALSPEHRSTTSQTP